MKNLVLLLFAFSGAVVHCLAGNYIEYKISSGAGVSGVMRVWGQGGNSRSEFSMKIPGLPTEEISSTLFLANQPSKLFTLNEKDKTYMESDIHKNEDYKDDEAKDYEVTVIGKETVNGYATTHVTLKQKDATTILHWWLTKDVKFYNDLKNMKAKYMSSKGMYAALAAKGVDGFPVRMVVDGNREDRKTQMDLVKAETTEVPASRFSLNGYTKKEAPTMNLPAGMDAEKMKNMTPEERQKLMEEMMKQYGK